jgi:manganese-transporting P-type ATPase
VYKVLALNCLISAYMMSSLYLQGLKYGDTQMTLTGLMTAALFYLISIAKPLPSLSETKPPGSVFDPSVLFSIFFQFLTHLGCLVAVLLLCDWRFGEGGPDGEVGGYPLGADAQFQPNLVNTTVYLLYTAIQVNNFFVNYRGAPFTENIWENRSLYCSFLTAYLFIALLVSGLIEPLNDLLQIVPFPSPHFRALLAAILAADLLLALVFERISRLMERK